MYGRVKWLPVNIYAGFEFIYLRFTNGICESLEFQYGLMNRIDLLLSNLSTNYIVTMNHFVLKSRKSPVQLSLW